MGLKSLMKLEIQIEKLLGDMQKEAEANRQHFYPEHPTANLPASETSYATALLETESPLNWEVLFPDIKNNLLCVSIVLIYNSVYACQSGISTCADS
jgi:hypothetical protein